MKPNESKPEPQEGAKTLTISTSVYADFDAVVLMAKEFETQHEGVKLEFDYNMDVSEIMSLSQEEQDRRRVIPFGFALPVVYVNSRVTDALEADLSGRTSVSTLDMISWYNSAREQSVLDADSPVFFGGGTDYRTTPLYQTECIRYIDIEGPKASLASQEFVNYLESLMALPGDAEDSQFSLCRNIPLSDELVRCKVTGGQTKAQNILNLGQAAFSWIM